MVLTDAPGEGSGLGGVAGDLAAAIHVQSKGDAALCRQLLGPLAGIVVVPPPLVDHQHSRTRPGEARVVSQIAGELVALMCVDHLLGVQLGECQRRKGQTHQQQHNNGEHSHEQILSVHGIEPLQ